MGSVQIEECHREHTSVGTYVFLSLYDDHKSLIELHKFDDDCTLAEIIKEMNTSRLQLEIDSDDSWSSLNHN